MRNTPTLRVLAAIFAAVCLLTGPAAAQDAPIPEPGTEPGLMQPELPSPPQSVLPPLSDQQPGNRATKRPGPDAAAPAPATNHVPRPSQPKDRDAVLAELYAHLAKAPDAVSAEPIAKTIEGLWLHSGSDTIGLLMRRALKAASEHDNDLALKLLDAVVDLGPDYAEGFSRRAYIYYLQNDYERAVGDLRRALALDPNHFKALDGLARILRENGQKKSALKVYQQLLRIYPFMPGAKDAADELTVEVEGQGI